MSQYENIYLIGPMGVGKTTVGKQLASKLNCPFYDSDKFVEQKTGVDIATIFEFEGEMGFRTREQKAVESLTRLRGVVLATGGGAILNERNRELLTKNGFVVYLLCSLNRLVDRTRKDKKRPLLKTNNPRKRLEEIIEERDSLYQACADCVVNTGRNSSRMTVNTILKKFSNNQKNRKNENFAS